MISGERGGGGKRRVLWSAGWLNVTLLVKVHVYFPISVDSAKTRLFKALYYLTMSMGCIQRCSWCYKSITGALQVLRGNEATFA